MKRRSRMSKDQKNIVIMAGYQDIPTAKKDFDGLIKLVKDKKVRTDGLILAQHDMDGKAVVSETGDHLGRKGMGFGGGVGLLVGLFAPPLLAATVVGAAAGAVLGKIAKKKVESGLEKGLAEKLKPGSAVILAIVDEDDRLVAEQALAGSPAKSVVSMEDKGLKEALAEAGGKFNPDRTVLPIPDKSFGGTVGRTLDNSVADWFMIPHAKAPEDA